MTTYIISYDIKEDATSSKRYDALYKDLKSFSPHWSHLESTWIVKSDKTAEQVRNQLDVHLNKDDKLLVVKSDGVGAWCGFNKSSSDWLKKHL